MDGTPVTALLARWREGDEGALAELLPVVYREIRRVAAAQLKRERAGHTLSPTDLVSEVFLRLAGGSKPEVSDRVHFVAVAAHHVRQILVEHARKRAAVKRGGLGRRQVTLDEALMSNDRPAELVMLDDALEALARLDPKKGRMVELCYFGGLSNKEIAELEGLHHNTVGRELKLAEAWLLRRMNEP